MSLSLEAKIESILFYSGTPMTLDAIISCVEVEKTIVIDALHALAYSLKDRGVVLLEHNNEYSLVTHPESSLLIEKITKEELRVSLSQASLETLSIILYKGPVTKKEIEYIRGVQVSYSLRALLMRGLIEKVPSKLDERIFLYSPTTESLKFLGISHVRDLPGYEEVGRQIDSKKDISISEE